jgi:hypothetical protein
MSGWSSLPPRSEKSLGLLSASRTGTSR